LQPAQSSSSSILIWVLFLWLKDDFLVQHKVPTNYADHCQQLGKDSIQPLPCEKGDKKTGEQVVKQEQEHIKHHASYKPSFYLKCPRPVYEEIEAGSKENGNDV
jgi:hypothetical protein